MHGEGLGPRRSRPRVRGEAREECARHCPGSALCAPGRGGDSCAARSPGRGGGSGLCRGWARWFTHGGVPCAGSRLSLEWLKSESERAASVCSGAELSALSFREKWERLVPEKVAFLRHGVGTVGVSEWVHNVDFANVRCSGGGVLGLPCGSRSESRILEPTGAHLGSQSRLSVRDAENQAAGEGCSVCSPWWGPGPALHRTAWRHPPAPESAPGRPWACRFGFLPRRHVVDPVSLESNLSWKSEFKGRRERNCAGVVFLWRKLCLHKYSWRWKRTWMSVSHS